MAKIKSTVACVKVHRGKDPQLVFTAVKRAMELANWQKYVQGQNIVLKVNVVWDKLYPSCTTTPMVIESVIKVLRKKFKSVKITIVDTDTPGIMHADNSFRNLGIDKMANQYNVKTINLTKTKFRTVSLKGKILHKFKVSRVLLDADTIISIPVIKTHQLSTVSLSLKNQWGCIHDLRHNFHLHLAKAIVDVNNYFRKKVRLAITDGLFGMEGNGPKNGQPVKVGFVFASSNLVALDTLTSQTMGFNPNEIEHIVYAQKNGLGKMVYKLVGDKPPVFHFASPQRFHLAFWVEMFLRKLGPFYEWLFFKTPILFPLRVAARVYNDIWYYTIGCKYRDKAMKTDFGYMWKKYLD